MEYVFTEERWLTTRHLGRPLRIYAELDSTNTQALRHAEDVSLHGLTLLAHAQSAGRGQYGRSWLTTPRSSVLLSALLFPPAHLRRPVLLTSWAAVAVCDLVHALTGSDAAVKWPNDIYLGGKKVCGILIEQRTTADRRHPLATVVGVGLNVTQTADDFAQAGLPLAGSLRSVAGQSHESDAVALALIEHLDRWYDRLDRGEHSTLQSAWRTRLGLVGHDVIVERADGVVMGHLHELTFDAAILTGEDDIPMSLAPESIRHITRRGGA